ncbi:hypothetical protein [Aliikangiella coralliicola]|uniref:Uncharacterized protein n=1 Tax=Aliikangiella coralliicola TaxID=2592383 RepID=A0A545UHU2_9GAMM|nr:hypothetical protein [Aliikangiella coralliicola]TQV89040.1 hypothetical protein FLL46_05785 [Aliikangiella coralliicola]
MKNYRLVYSDFSNKIIDLNYAIRSIWICFAGLCLIIINATETGSGFSGRLSLEGYLIFSTISTFFFVNYLTRNHPLMELVLGFLTIISSGVSGWLIMMAYSNAKNISHSLTFLMVYSLGTVIILLVLKPTKALN